MTNAERKALLPELRAIAQGVSATTAAGMASRLLSRFEKQRRPMRPSRKAKQEKRQARNEETARIREAVFARAGSLCELCAAQAPTDMHHLESGRGRRLELQAVSNCMAVCRLCHRAYHMDPQSFRLVVSQWCRRWGFPLPSKLQEG